MSIWRRVRRDALILCGSASSLVLLQVAFRYLSVRELSVAHYGRVALLLSIFNFAGLLGTYGIPNAASRLAARTFGMKRDRDVLRATSLAVLAPCLAASIVMGIVTWCVTGAPYDGLIAAVGVPPFVWAGVYRGFIQGKGMIWASAAIQPANLLLQTLVLIVMLAAGVNVGIGYVLLSFYVGNFGAYFCARFQLSRALRRSSLREDQLDPDSSPRSILSFAAWLSLANVAVLLLEVLPRISLSRYSYTEVAYFDLALLIYTIPQRLRASLLAALLPIAAVERKRNAQITVPGNSDLAVVTVVLLVVVGILWATHGLRAFLGLVGMSAYSGAEPLLLIILFAAPAEVFYGLNSAVLQALGESRRLGLAAITVLAVTFAVAMAGSALGPKFLAAVLVVDYWVLHFLSRHLLYRSGVCEKSVLLPALASRVRRGVSAVAESSRA